METKLCKSLKHLKSGDIHLVDVDAVSSKLRREPAWGDVLQYELHNHCKKNTNKNTDPNADNVVKLASLCYSKKSVTCFTSMDRFIGCVYYICSYLLQNEKYEEALTIANCLEIRREALLVAIKNNKDAFNFLCTLHSCFICSAIKLASTEDATFGSNQMYSHNLAVMSLKFFEFNLAKQAVVAKKILRKSKQYLLKVKHKQNQNVAIFYNLLKTIMSVLDSKFSNVDFCLYFLFKIERIKNLDYSNRVEVFNHLENVLCTFLLLSDSSAEIKQSFIGLINFFFVPSNENSLSGDDLLKKCLKVQDEGESEVLFLMISVIFHHGIQHWWKLFEDNWSTHASVERLKNLFSGILDLQKLFGKSERLYCGSDKTPRETCFGDLLAGNLQKIQNTVRQCLKSKVPGSLSLVPLSRESFSLSIKCVNTMKVTGCCETQRACTWKYAVIHHTNLIEDILRQEPCSEVWIHLEDCSQELLSEIVRAEYQQPYDKKRLNVLFQRWHQSCLKQKKFLDGLFVCAALYVSYPDEEANVIRMWLQTKTECDNKIFQGITVLEILKTCESAMKDFSPKYNRHLIKSKSVLLMELKAYASCTAESFKESPEFCALVSRIWKQLEKLDLDIWEMSFACICLASAHISGGGKQLPKNFIRKCEDIITKLLTWTVKDKRQCRSFVHAANLKLALFLHTVKIVENSEGSTDTNKLVLGYLQKAEEENVKFGEDVDTNLTCNVIPASSHLTVELESTYLKALKGILILWQDALKSGLEELPTPEEFVLWLDNVRLVAILFELYGEHRQSLTVWLTYYVIGKLCNDSSAMLLGISHLFGKCSDANTLEWDALTKVFEAEKQDNEILVTYWLAVAFNHLKNKRPAKCLEILKKAQKILENLNMTAKVHGLLAKFWCLVSQFLVCYPDHDVEFGFRGGIDLRVIVFKAFNYAAAGTRSQLSKTATQLECAELILIMMEVSMWAFHFHEIYHQSDFMRLFMDDLYQIVQILFLPTRTAEILIRLAEVDLICEKLSDCREKLNKVKSIFCMSHSTKTAKSKTPELKSAHICFDVDKSPSCPRAISPARFLEVPISGQTDEVSPIRLHLGVGFGTEKTAVHGNDCNCRPCQNVHVQILKMTALGLEAEVLRMESQWKEAASRYAEAYAVLNKLESLKGEAIGTLEPVIPESLERHLPSLGVEARYVQFYTARFLLKHALFQTATTDSFTENVKNTGQKIMSFMREFTYERKLLMWKFAELKLLWLAVIKGEPIPLEISPIEEYKTGEITQTPIVKRPGDLSSVGKSKREKNVSSKVKKPAVLDLERASSNSDEKNTGFLVPENFSFEKNYTVLHRKLGFRTNESPTNIQTIKKTPATRVKSIMPKKLDMDQAG